MSLYQIFALQGTFLAIVLSFLYKAYSVYTNEQQQVYKKIENLQNEAQKIKLDIAHIPAKSEFNSLISDVVTIKADLKFNKDI